MDGITRINGLSPEQNAVAEKLRPLLFEYVALCKVQDSDTQAEGCFCALLLVTGIMATHAGEKKRPNN